MNKPENRVILGIDPGTNIMGYGLIEINGASIKLLSLGVIKLNNLDDHALKLKKYLNRLFLFLNNTNRMN